MGTKTDPRKRCVGGGGWGVGVGGWGAGGGVLIVEREGLLCLTLQCHVRNKDG